MEGISPIIAFRPSAEAERIGEIYTVSRGLFRPDTETSNALVLMLNEFEIGKPTGVSDIDSVIPDNGSFLRHNKFSLEAAEQLAENYQLNILGGVFLGFCESFGIQAGEAVGKACVESNDVEFMITLYPDLAGYFYNTQQIPEERKKFAEAVINNNSGNFLIVSIDGEDRVFTELNLQEIALLKRVYRHCVAETIPWNRAGVRDNVVHTPVSYEELRVHTQLFKERMKSNETHDTEKPS